MIKIFLDYNQIAGFDNSFTRGGVGVMGQGSGGFRVRNMVGLALEFRMV